MKKIEDIAALDTIFTDSFPKEINKAKIKEIFEILQSKERPDLVKEMKNLVLLKTNGQHFSKLTEEKKTDLFSKMNNHLSSINQILPNEILKKILEKLNFKSLYFAMQTCKSWRDIIQEFELVKAASSKFL